MESANPQLDVFPSLEEVKKAAKSGKGNVVVLSKVCLFC